MSTPTDVNDWLVEEAFRQFGIEQVGEAFAGNANRASGTDGLWLLVLEDAFEKIQEAHDTYSTPHRAFNDVTGEWPQAARCRMAAYEYERANHDDDQYNSELRLLAENGNALDMTYEQTDLNCYFGDNPFDDPELTDDEARAVIMLRTVDPDTSPEIVSEIEDFQTFRERFRELEDAEAALRAHHYGSDFPAQLAAELAPPEEWETDPGNLESGECVYCRTAFFHVNHHSEGVCWMSDAGEVTEVDHVDENGQFETVGARHGALLCAGCEDDFVSNSNVFLRIGGSDELSKVRTGPNLRRDYGVGDTPYTPQDETEDDLWASILLEGPRASEDIITIEPDPSASSLTNQEQLLDDVVAGNQEIDAVMDTIESGTFYVQKTPGHHGPSYRIHVRRSDIEAARAAKTMLENADSILADAAAA